MTRQGMSVSPWSLALMQAEFAAAISRTEATAREAQCGLEEVGYGG